jgi:hypothetical protein
MRILLLLATGCVTATAVPAAFHPTASDTDRSVGLSIGGAYVKDSNTKILTIPYGEGSVRIPMSPGQLSLHVAPDVAYLGYRYDVSKLADGGVGFGIEPLVGGSYYSETSTDDQGMETKQSAFALMLGIAPIISFKAGPGFAYFVPKLGYQYVKELDAPAGTMNDTSKLYVLGLSAGIDLGNGVSVELAVHRVDNADDRTPDPEAAWVIVPSVGVRH